MKYDTDPVRWTNSPLDAPEVLRGPLMASRDEGPSDLQMKTLALKLAALSAGTAAAASASAAHASTTAAGGAGAAGVAGTGSLVAKVVVSLALVGAATTGLVAWQAKPLTSGPARIGEPVAPGAAEVVEPAQAPAKAEGPAGRAPAPSAPRVEPVVTPSPSPAPGAQPAEAVVVPEQVAAPQVAAPLEPASPSPADEPVAQPARPQRATASSARAGQARSVPAETSYRSVRGVTVQAATPSEMELLRSARAALSSRPRQAFQITEQHRAAYPNGTFAQERDVLAIEALLRAGETETARTLAQRFVREHPNSAHAHRFRESLGL